MADERNAVDPAETVETVKIKDSKAPGGHVVINAADFDEKKHHKYTEPKADDSESDDGSGDVTRAAMVEIAESKGLKVKSNMTKAEIQEMLDLEALPKPELVERAKAQSVDTSGSKADLVNRIVAS